MGVFPAPEPSETSPRNVRALDEVNVREPIIVSDVQVAWNPLGAPSGNSLVLLYAILGDVFWTGSDSTGSLMITPSPTVTIPGNNVTSTIFFLPSTKHIKPVVAHRSQLTFQHLAVRVSQFKALNRVII